MAEIKTNLAIASASGGSGYSSILVNYASDILGILVETDGTNDPTVTVRDNTVASGDAVMPATTFDASALGLNGFTGLRIPCKTAIHVVIVCAGAAKVYIYYM